MLSKYNSFLTKKLKKKKSIGEGRYKYFFNEI